MKKETPNNKRTSKLKIYLGLNLSTFAKEFTAR
jgi:hypothetical protein